MLVASAGMYTTVDGPHHHFPVDSNFKSARIARDRQPYLNNDLQSDLNIGDPDWVRREEFTGRLPDIRSSRIASSV